MNKNENKAITVLVLIIIAAFVLPWKNVNWGRMQFGQGETVTVIGESEIKQKNEVASFSAGVNVINIKKDDAIAEVNKKIKELTDSVKTFGISEDDIKTQNMSVFQQQEQGNKWVVNNTIEITLRDVSKTQELVDLLNTSGANNVYGPNFRIENTAGSENGLVDDAIADAKTKAEKIAKASGRKLGKIVTVIEGNNGSISPMFKTMDAGIGGAGAEAGTSTISKTLTVSFELK